MSSEYGITYSSVADRELKDFARSQHHNQNEHCVHLLFSQVQASHSSGCCHTLHVST